MIRRWWPAYRRWRCQHDHWHACHDTDSLVATLTCQDCGHIERYRIKGLTDHPAEVQK